LNNSFKKLHQDKEGRPRMEEKKGRGGEREIRRMGEWEKGR
jgi:hypothetical protein